MGTGEGPKAYGTQRVPSEAAFHDTANPFAPYVGSVFRLAWWGNGEGLFCPGLVLDAVLKHRTLLSAAHPLGMEESINRRGTILCGHKLSLPPCYLLQMSSQELCK